MTVSERGQIVIPAQAGRDLGIGAGDKLPVLADPNQGLALMTIDLLMRNLQGSSELMRQIQTYTQGEAGEREEPDGPGDQV